MPSKTELAKVKKFHNLLLNSLPGEAPVEVKKNTVATMPTIRLNRSGMEKFLQGKTRRLVTCAKKKTYMQDQTVKLILEFTVANTGKVSSVKITQPDGMNDPGLFNCIRQKVQAWIFPKDPNRKPLMFRTVLFL